MLVERGADQPVEAGRRGQVHRGVSPEGLQVVAALRRLRSGGPMDCTSDPRRCPQRLDPDLLATIVATRLETLHGPHRLAYELGRPRSTIYGVLRRQQLSRLSFIDQPTRTVVPYERNLPGELLHVDVNKLGRIRDGGGWQMPRTRDGLAPAKRNASWSATTTSTWPSTIFSRVAFVQVSGRRAFTELCPVRGSHAITSFAGTSRHHRTGGDRRRQAATRRSIVLDEDSGPHWASVIHAAGSTGTRPLEKRNGSIRPFSKGSPTRRSLLPRRPAAHRPCIRVSFPAMAPGLIRPSEWPLQRADPDRRCAGRSLAIRRPGTGWVGSGSSRTRWS